MTLVCNLTPCYARDLLLPRLTSGEIDVSHLPIATGGLNNNLFVGDENDAFVGICIRTGCFIAVKSCLLNR